MYHLLINAFGSTQNDLVTLLDAVTLLKGLTPNGTAPDAVTVASDGSVFGRAVHCGLNISDVLSDSYLSGMATLFQTARVQGSPFWVYLDGRAWLRHEGFPRSAEDAKIPAIRRVFRDWKSTDFDPAPYQQTLDHLVYLLVGSENDQIQIVAPSLLIREAPTLHFYHELYFEQNRPVAKARKQQFYATRQHPDYQFRRTYAAPLSCWAGKAESLASVKFRFDTPHWAWLDAQTEIRRQGGVICQTTNAVVWQTAKQPTPDSDLLTCEIVPASWYTYWADNPQLDRHSLLHRKNDLII
jgi:hypothetical protein